MDFHMKTTLMIEEGVMLRVREKAAREGSTISELVEAGLRLLLEPPPTAPRKLPPLPVFSMGKPLVDPADRRQLYQIFEEEDLSLYGSAQARETPVRPAARKAKTRARPAKRT